MSSLSDAAYHPHDFMFEMYDPSRMEDAWLSKCQFSQRRKNFSGLPGQKTDPNPKKVKSDLVVCESLSSILEVRFVKIEPFVL